MLFRVYAFAVGGQIILITSFRSGLTLLLEHFNYEEMKSGHCATRVGNKSDKCNSHSILGFNYEEVELSENTPKPEQSTPRQASASGHGSMFLSGLAQSSASRSGQPGPAGLTAPADKAKRG